MKVLRPEIIEALGDIGIVTPTDIQVRLRLYFDGSIRTAQRHLFIRGGCFFGQRGAIEQVMGGKDVLIASETGENIACLLLVG
jgi:hypothetical protein